MNWNEIFYFSIISAALLLSVLGTFFTAVIPGIDRFSKHFFLYYFVTFVLCCLSGFAEIILSYYSGPGVALYLVEVFECLVMAVPLPMLTIYLLHCYGGNFRTSRLLRTVLVLWAVYCILLVSSSFIDGFTVITPDNLYSRGPLYPLLLLPLIIVLLLTLASVIYHRKQLSRKTFLSFLVAILPIMFSLITHLFIDAYELIDVSYVLSALSMYGLVLSDQIEQDRLHRQEIADQRAKIMVLQMRPHFIYNTLMSIYSLINNDPQKARQVTNDFTDYLRKNFNAVAGIDPIPFSAELEHTRAYLAVEQAQFEDMLLVEYDTSFTNFRLPPLTLQPIAENAVKHGMDPYAGPLKVSIRSYHENSASVIIVEDNGSGFNTVVDNVDGNKTAGDNDSGIDGFNTTEDTGSEPHPALTNIRQRLKLMYNGKLEITPREGGGTVVTITIPDHKAEE